MTHEPASFAVPATLLLAVLLLAPALPAGADGLPTLDPGVPSLDCGSLVDAGNSHAEATWLWPDAANPCIGTLAPVVDEQDWFSIDLQRGGQLHVNVVSFTADADICLYGPWDDEVPLRCSALPLFSYDAISIEAAEWGPHRLQVRLAAGAGNYLLSVWRWDPAPADRPDMAVLDFQVRKPVLTTDLAPTGVVNPLGDWAFDATITNLGHGRDCPEVWFTIQGETFVPERQVGPVWVAPVFLSDAVEVPWPDCLGPGQSTSVHAAWRPGAMVGDVTVSAVVYSDHDLDWANNVRSVDTFVLVGGL